MSSDQRTAFYSSGLAYHTRFAASEESFWRPLSSTSLSLDDLGSLQGATLVERLRTVSGQPLDVELHLERLQASARVLSIHWPEYLTAELVRECVMRNRTAHSAPDLAVVILLTPGLSHSRPIGESPTVIIHSTDLHWPQLAHWYQHGQALVTSTNRNVPASCWSPHIKTRSRLHYYLADQQAHVSPHPFSGAAMLSLSGQLTESSVANLLMIDGQSLISPPIESVLHGLSLRRTLRLAGRLGIEVRFESIELSRARAADGLLLTGSSGCLWPASHLDEAAYQAPLDHPVYRSLRDAWIADLGLDYVAQATQVCPPVFKR